MPVPQNPITVAVSAPYPDLSKVGRDGTREYLVSVRADDAIAVTHFPTKQAARDFRSQEIEDVLEGAFS